MLNFKFDVITITEIKIQTSTQPTFDITLQNYNLYQTSTWHDPFLMIFGNLNLADMAENNRHLRCDHICISHNVVYHLQPSPHHVNN